MPVQINEVIVRAIITGAHQGEASETASSNTDQTVSAVTKNELLDLVDEIINDKKER